MTSNCFFTKTIFTISLNPIDKNLPNLAIEILAALKDKNIIDVVIDLSLFETITSDDINFIQKLVDVCKLNNIFVVVCNFNVYSASILFHFIDDINFKTALDTQSAMNVIKNR